MISKIKAKAATFADASNAKMEDKTLSVHEEFSPLTRLFHWIRALSIFVLIATGFYIAYPFLGISPAMESVALDAKTHTEVVTASNGFLQAYIRSIHMIFGVVLIAISFFRLYLFGFDPRSKPERLSINQAFSPTAWIAQIKTYLFIGKHPHIDGAYNPLQFFTYFALGLLVLFISLTGVVLYYTVYNDGLGAVFEACFKWFELLCGGVANVRVIHHILTWVFVLFIPVHIYMAVWNSLKYPNGGVDAIVSGKRYTDEVKV